MGKKQKCKIVDKFVGAPLWVVTFGDMMSLLLTFFVLLLSFAQMDVVSFENMAGSLSDALGVQKVQPENYSPSGKDMVAEVFQRELVLVDLTDAIRGSLLTIVSHQDVAFEEDENGYKLRMKNKLVFQGNSVRISPKMHPVLQDIASKLSGMQNNLIVIGHAEKQKKAKDGPYPDAWAVSVARAAAVVEVLTADGGLEPERVIAQGQGSNDPFETEGAEDGWAISQQVEVLIINQGQEVLFDELHFFSDDDPTELSGGSDDLLNLDGGGEGEGGEIGLDEE